MKVIHLIVASAIQLCAAVAYAHSGSPAFYDDCMADARHTFRECRDEGYRASRCEHDYARERNRCGRIESRMDRVEPMYPTYQNPGERFVPIPIPQRRPYILPGMN